MPHFEDLSKYPIRRRLVTAGNPDIVLCDEKISIFDVLREYCGMDVPGYRFKTHCPFNVEHEDPTERCFQVYENNTAWCYAHQARYTPTVLFALTRQWSRIRSARYLLERAGLNRRMTYQEKYGAISQEIEQRRESPGDVQELAMTLRSELEMDPGYQAVEYEEAVRAEWVQLLAALDRLAAKGANAEQLRKWYEVARRRLKAVSLTVVQHSG